VSGVTSATQAATAAPHSLATVVGARTEAALGSDTMIGGPPVVRPWAGSGVVEGEVHTGEIRGLPEKSRERTTAASAAMPGSPSMQTAGPSPADHRRAS